jgi:hypothetical protein
MSRPTSITPTAGEVQADQWTSVARASYVTHNIRRAETLSPSRREAEKVQERLKTGPAFVAASNYDLSFHGQGGRASPSCRPPVSVTPALPFVETSTSRASFKGIRDPVAFPERVRGASPELRKPLPLKASSVSRQAYVNHHITKVPVRRQDAPRTLPNVKFQAVSTMTASYVAPS